MKISPKILAALPFFLFVFVMPTSAQSTIKWYWAYIETKHQVIAYDVSGNTHVLLERVRPSNLRRIDDLTAVVMIEKQNDYSAYILTSENAYPVAKIYTAELPDDYYVQRPDGVEALALMPPYILIWNHKYTQPLLFNRETQAVQTLNLEAWETLRLSKDGRYLRYRVQKNEENRLVIHWHIAEYDIREGTTRVIFERDVKAPDWTEPFFESCEPDPYGEKWFCEQVIGTYSQNRTHIEYKHVIIFLAGQTEAVADNQYLKVGLNGDWFLLASDGYYNYCDEQCTFNVTNYSTGETQSFNVSQMALPQGVKFALNYSEVLDKDRILLYDVQSSTTLYLLQDKTRLSYLGVTPCCHIMTSLNDRRWRVFDDIRDMKKPQALLVDMQSGHIVLRKDGVIDQVGFTANGAYLDGVILYPYADNKFYIMEEGLHPGAIVDVLPDGIAIGAYTSDIVDDEKVGIYITSNQTGRKLLIKGAEPIFYPFDLSLQ